MDFVFGTLATDELRQLHHTLKYQGVQHGDDITPQAPKPDEPVTLRIRVGPEVQADQVTCYYTTDGSEPDGSTGTAHNGHALPCHQIGVEWDTIAWRYVAVWQCKMPPQPEGTVVRYRIGAWADEQPEAFADSPRQKATTERAAAAFFRGQPLPELPPVAGSRPTTFTYHHNNFTTPGWAWDAVIYQVFVDRFYPGDGQAWNHPDRLSGFFGGTLWGVRDKLDYIADLGANCIWLTPIFPSPTHHGYDATDYYHVEPRLGGDDALHALVDAAHARGIRVLLDMAVNHCSDQHPKFQDALNNPDSPYRAFFTLTDDDIGYEVFFGVPSMPVINVTDPGARAWLLDVAAYWLREFDVDGYRLDHANGAGPGFWADFRAACRAVKPDTLLFGEIVEAPDTLRRYIGRLDGLLDFMAEDTLRKVYAYGIESEAGMERFLAQHTAYFPDDFIMPTFIDNHDMDRFLFAANGDKEKLRRAAEAQFKLPGPPVIYYGTEVGMNQRNSKHDGDGLEESRLPMIWDEAEQDRTLLAFYKDLIKQRKAR